MHPIKEREVFYQALKGMIPSGCMEQYCHWCAVAKPFDTSLEEFSIKNMVVTPQKVEEADYIFPVAMLHDVVEDGYMTFQQLEEAFDLTQEQLKAIQALTRKRGEKYFDYIYRVRQNGLATVVKLSDLKHNISRCAQDVEHRWGLLRRYAKAYAILTDQWEE